MNDVEKSTKNHIHQIRAKLKCGNIRVKFPLITIFDNFPMILMQKKKTKKK